MLATQHPPSGSPEAQSPDGNIAILWLTAGLSCDGETVALTGATQPSLEDLLGGGLPWIPRVRLFHPFLALEVGDEFVEYFHRAAGRDLGPFMLVVEGSIPDESNKAEGYWATFGTDPVTRQPITTCSWIDRLAPRAWAVVAAGTCAAYGGIHAIRGNPTGHGARSGRTSTTAWDSTSPRQPGHRFFFSPQEVAPLPPDAGPAPVVTHAVLIAGIGNVFLGDDGFGVEVAQRMAGRTLPPGVVVADYGIRGYDLATALVRGADHTILVDACPRGERPGTVFVLEPEPAELDAPEGAGMFDAHDLHPLHVLRLARSLGADLGPVVVVGCEPATLGPPEGHMGLSEEMGPAVDEAIKVIEGLIERFLNQPGG